MRSWALRISDSYSLQLRSDVALSVDQGLLADVLLGHSGQIGLGHLQVVAEDLVVAYFQGLDARSARLLQVSYPPLGVSDAARTLSNWAEKPVPDHLHILGGRGIVDDCLADRAEHILAGVEVHQVPQECYPRNPSGPPSPGARAQRLQAMADAQQVSGPGNALYHTARQTLQVRDILFSIARTRVRAGVSL